MAKCWKKNTNLSRSKRLEIEKMIREREQETEMQLLDEVNAL